MKKVDQIIIEKIAKDSLTYGLFERKKKHIELIECIGESFESIIETIREINKDLDLESLPGKSSFVRL